MNIGISTACLYPLETEKALIKLTDKGFHLFEIFYNTHSELSTPFTQEVKGILARSGSRLKSVHPFTSGYEPYMIFTNYKRRFLDSLEFYKQYFTAASALGAQILVIHGDRHTEKTGGITDEEYFEKFARLSILGEQYGITVAQENVNLFRSQNPAFIKRMKASLGDRAKFVLDIKQAVRSGNNPLAVCEAMGDGLVHLHLNDYNDTQDCLLPGKGHADYNGLFALLRKYKYRGDAVIEVYRTNFDKIDQLRESRAYLEGIKLRHTA